MSIGDEARSIMRFGLVGLTATAAHLAIVFALVATTELAAIVMHVAGFLGAFSISFLGHYVYTFRSTKRLSTAAMRFVAVSCCALLASSAIAWLGTKVGLPQTVSLLVAAASVPAASYVASRELVFR